MVASERLQHTQVRADKVIDENIDFEHIEMDAQDIAQINKNIKNRQKNKKKQIKQKKEIRTKRKSRKQLRWYGVEF